MKKIIFVFCVLFLFTFQVKIFSQCDVSNHTNYNLAISEGKVSRMIAPGSTERIPFFPRQGEVSFQISWREQGSSKRENVVDVVRDGNLIITDEHLRGEKTSLPEVTQHHYVPSPEVINSEFQTSLVIKNASSKILWIREGVLSGLVLKPDQASDTILVPLGMIELTFLVDRDSIGGSTGRNYTQRVVTGLIAKEQDEFAITDTHLNIPSMYDQATFVFHNKTGFDVVGVGNIATGKVIAANSRMRQRRVEANEGFINTAWQYFDDKGIKRQAISEFIVIDGRVMVDILPTHLRRKFVR